MKKILMILLPLLLIVGCSHTRHTPFINNDKLFKISKYLFSEGSNKFQIEKLIGSPSMKVMVNKNKILLRYYYRNENVLTEHPPYWFRLFFKNDKHIFKERPGKYNFYNIYSSQTDHIIDLILIDDQLTEIRIDGKKITE